MRTLVDMIEFDTVDRSIIRQAVREAAARGLISRQQIRNASMGESARALIEHTLRRVT
jgi:hypothetical protein